MACTPYHSGFLTRTSPKFQKDSSIDAIGSAKTLGGQTTKQIAKVMAYKQRFVANAFPTFPDKPHIKFIETRLYKKELKNQGNG